MSDSVEVNDAKSQNRRNTEPVDSGIFNRLKLSYAENFHSSPSKLRAKLDETFPDEIKKAKDGSGSLISDKTIRNFFSAIEPPTASMKTLNWLCKVLLDFDSYGKALRSHNEMEIPPHLDKIDAKEPFNENKGKLEDRLKPYYEKTRGKLNKLKVLDMRESLPLDRIYTKTFFIAKSKVSNFRNHEEISRTLRDSDAITTFSEEKRMPAREKIKTSQYLMIFGGPGAGKTSFIKNIGLRYLDQSTCFEDFEKLYIPVYVSVKVSGDNINNFGLENIIAQRFDGILSRIEIKNMLQNGDFLILLDALDEYSNIVGTCDQIVEFLDVYDKNRFIVTTRLGIPECRIEQFDEVRIASFDIDQISEFVNSWFEVSKEKDEQVDPDDNWQPQEYSVRFLSELKLNKSISQAATNPLTLTYLCLRFKEEFGFPKNVSELLKDVVNILLRRWDATRRINRIPIKSNKISDARKVELFAQIAYRGFTRKPSMQFLWSEDELKKEVRECLSKVSTIHPDEIDDGAALLLQVLIRDHGLLIPQTDLLHSFPHLTFQKYFVAEYINSQLGNDHILHRSILQRYWLDRQWEQVFLMLSEKLNNADNFFRQMFWNVNLAINGRDELTKMLTWMYKITQSFYVDSSSWRAFILATGLEADLYLLRYDVNANYSYAQELSDQAVVFNQSRKSFTPNQPKLVVALYLVIIYDLAIDQIEESTKLKQASPFTKRELEVDVDTTISKEFELAIAKAKLIEDMPNLVEDLQSLYDIIPSDTDSILIWQDWANNLRDLMLKRFDIGHRVILEDEDKTALEDYIYGNNLLLKCMLGENVSTPSLRDAIFDHLLLPESKTPQNLYA
ncbi:MAG: hypothetical protein WCP16_02295 [Pseudanabaena sp. ELA645]|jgi:hypothetical protein